MFYNIGSWKFMHLHVLEW